MSNIINFPIVEPITEPEYDWDDSEHITGEMLCEFLITHNIECASDLKDFSHFVAYICKNTRFET
jgi:hypothetical protein